MHGQLQTEIARHVWQSRYCWTTEAGIAEPNIDATWQRVAAAGASIEGADAGRWQTTYLQAFNEFRFLPAGRILAGAGTGAQVQMDPHPTDRGEAHSGGDGGDRVHPHP